jgi:hypothetical protein
MQRKDRIRRLLFRLLLLSALSWLINFIRRNRDEDAWEFPHSSSRWERSESVHVEASEAGKTERPRKASRAHRPLSARRVATSLTFAVLFFAGAAFTAGAGDQAARLLEDDSQCMTEQAVLETPSPEESSACADAASAAPAEEPEASEPEAATPEVAAEAAPAAEDPGFAEPQAGSAGSASMPSAPAASAATPKVASEAVRRTLKPSERPVKARGTHRWVIKRAREAPAHPPEIEDPNAAATIWLNRALPDPTPPARRLAPRFARNLARVARNQRVDWALLLSVLRVQGDRSAVPATRGELKVLAKRLRKEHSNRDAWAATLAISGRTSFADRAVALRNYNRAVGLRSLVTGLQKAKPRLVKALLNDERASIYAGGREDLRRDRVDVRVVVLMRYLAETFDQVTVSSLHSGHRMYSRPGVVSAHMYGHAVDISGLGNASIFGNQQPGGLTETAVRAILLLPSEVQPRQIISLLGLGGASFPLSDHADHIHVGY